MWTRCWAVLAALAAAAIALGCEGGQTGDVGVSRSLNCCPGAVRDVSLGDALAMDAALEQRLEQALGSTGERVIETVLVGPAKLWADRGLEPPSARATPARLTLTATGARYTDREDEANGNCDVCPDSTEIVLATSLELPELSATLGGTGSTFVAWREEFFLDQVTLDELGLCSLDLESSGGPALYCGQEVWTNSACVDDEGWRDTPVDPRTGLELGALLRELETVPIALDCRALGNRGGTSFEAAALVRATFPERYCPAPYEAYVPGIVSVTSSAFAELSLVPAYATLEESGCPRPGCGGSCSADESRRCTRTQVLYAAFDDGDFAALNLLFYVEDDGTRQSWLSLTGESDGRAVECEGARTLE